MRPTRFLESASGVSERMSGFMAHLRLNGYTVGSRETELVLRALDHVDVCHSDSVRLASRVILASGAEQFQGFDELFDAYWFNAGRSRSRLEEKDVAKQTSSVQPFRPGLDESQTARGDGEAYSPETTSDEDGAMAHGPSDGRLIGSRISNMEKVDLREFMMPEQIEEAQRVARRLGKALCDRRSRRRVAANRGSYLDLRRTLRHSLSQGGEPLKLFRRTRPVRPVRLLALLDVSGSMLVYSRVFLAFLKGLVSHDTQTDAYLFHTSLVRISDALREPDTFKAVNALSLKAQGFGGGTRIGHNIEQFNRQYARHRVNARSVVIIMSDGYDTDPPSHLADALRRLKRRGCRIVWLNPLKAWKDYQPVAQGMSAALPFLDLFAAANTLESLAALETHLARL